MSIPFVSWLIALQLFLQLEVFRQWNVVADFWCLLSKFVQKRQIWVSESHFGEVGGDVQPWLMVRWKKAHSRLSIRVNWTFFVVYYGSGVVRRNVYSLAVFAGGRPLCTQILPGQGRSSSTVPGNRQPDTLGYWMVKTACFCVPSFSHNAGVRVTDRRICSILRLQSYHCGCGAL